MEVKTYFAPAVRSTMEEILKEYDAISTQKIFTDIFGSMTGIAAVLDNNRQIVYANTDFLKLLGINSIEPILGKRPGEVVACIHSTEQEAGCGTSQTCAYCGAVNAILESQLSGLKSTRETRITTDSDGKLSSLDLLVSSTPFTLAGQKFFALILQDISDEKRRTALERIFFHDLLNSAGGLNGLLTILKEGTDPEEALELINLSEEASREIVEEILLHRQIRAAESGELHVKIEPVNSKELLASAIGRIKLHEAGRGKEIVISDICSDVYFETDRILFQRVLINLLKNALEASPGGGIVTTGVESRGESVRVWVKNDQVIPYDVQMQLFQRSFSTKGSGRGIGTYSIRLLTENYLKGKVSFVSNPAQGTVFTVELNKVFPL